MKANKQEGHDGNQDHNVYTVANIYYFFFFKFYEIKCKTILLNASICISPSSGVLTFKISMPHIFKPFNFKVFEINLEKQAPSISARTRTDLILNVIISSNNFFVK